MLDKKGIFWFLGLTFGLTYAIEIALILAGFRVDGLPLGFGGYVVLLVMWVPGLATVITTRLITHEGMAITNVRLGSWKPYLANWLLIPACFFLIYGLTWLLGLGEPDWQLTHFKAIYITLGQEVPPMPSPYIIWLGLFAASMTVGALFNSFFCFGEELGWRGYLLPKLLPLGRPKTHLILGVIWSLWHLPLVLVGFVYPGHPFWGVIGFTLLTTFFGMYLNVLTLRHRSSVLAGWVHGLFNAQKLGVWALLFPTTNPLIAGYAGIIGLIVWLGVGLLAERLYQTHLSEIQPAGVEPGWVR